MLRSRSPLLRLASIVRRPVAALLCLVALGAQQAAAQTPAWPARAVTMAVGYPAGSGIDAVARFLADGLRERTGQPFIIENRPGAAGNLAAQAVARAAPDGYTVLFTPNSTHAANPHLYRKLAFDPVKDFQPVTTLLTLGFVLIVNPQVVPVSSVAELTDYLKARPDKLAYGSGNATGRIAAEMYRQATGFDAVHVPYKGVPPAITDLLGGQIHFLFADATLGLPQARAGKVRALAVTNGRRVSAAPDLPTMAEAGVRGYELSGWFALFLPAGAPADVTQRLADHANAIMTSEKGRAFLKNLGADPFPGSPEQLGKFVEAEIAKWGRIVKAAGIEPE
jgi:tripartite-type tricarboxylate transporter receptor subunit TctC